MRAWPAIHPIRHSTPGSQCAPSLPGELAIYGRTKWNQFDRVNPFSVVPHHGSAAMRSLEVSPCPGKCLAVAATPALCRPRMSAALMRATNFGASPKERVPMTGFRGLLLTSQTGAKSTLMPRAESSLPSARPTLQASFLSQPLPAPCCQEMAWSGPRR